MGTLVGPASLTSNVLNTFTVPTNTTVDLNAETTYWLTINEGETSRATFSVVGGDDETGASGWSIGNNRFWRSNEMDTWSEVSTSLVIAINGTAKTTTTNNDATGAPTVSGSAVLGEALSASTSGIADADGKTKAENGDAGHAYTYQWYRVDSDGVSNKTAISGATAQSYTLVSADVGKKIIVEVSFSDDDGNAEGPLASDPYPSSGTVIAADTAPPVVRSATIDGTVLVITFNEPLAPAPNLANNAFTVTLTPAGSTTGQPVTLTGAPAISGASVTLTLSEAVLPGDMVKVDYTKQTGTDNRLADADGNEVAGFTNRTVTNRTGGAGGHNAAPRFEVGRKEIELASRVVPKGTAIGAPLTATDANGDVLAYSLEPGGYYDTRDIQLFTVDEQTGQLYAGEFLNTMVDYRLGVYVKADDGDGGTDRVFVVVTPPPLPPGAPDDVSCKSGGRPPPDDNTLIAICWIGADGGPGITHVDIRYQKASTADDPHTIAEFSHTVMKQDLGPVLTGVLLHEFEVTVTGLAPGTEYVVSGRAYNDVGPGEWGQGSYQTTSGTAPQQQKKGLSAQFEGAPQNHDGTPFTVKMVLSDPVNNDEDDVRDHAVKTENGTVTGASKAPGSDTEWLVTIDPEHGKDTTVKVVPGGTCGDPGVLCTEDDETLDEMTMTTVPAPEPDPFTAKFDNVAGTHDGQATFRVDLIFSEAPANVKNKDIKDAVGITGGVKKHVRPVNGDDAHRRIGIAPDGDGDVVLTLLPTNDCADPLALCTADGRKLGSLLRLTIPGPASAPVVTPLTAAFDNPPKEHQGKQRLDVHIRFSEPVVGGKNAVKKAITIGRGAKWGVKDMDTTGHLYRSAMRPYDFRPVVITVAATTDCAAEGALCSAQGGMLEEGLRLEVPGPVAISVADATVQEGAGATLDFEVKLDRERHAAVTVDYATSDGTATAGADYTATDGTLTFAAGERSKTVAVTVLDDAHDDDGETVLLTLTNASGARIADGEATGTINNTDHMPRAWLARFGRTVAEQVVDTVEQRLRTAPSAGASVTIAGVAIGAGQASEDADNGLDALARWMNESPLEPGKRKVTGRDLLFGSTFALTTGAREPGAGTGSLWGHGAISSFDGHEDELTLDGEVASVMLGADLTHTRWSAGAMLSHSRGEGGYQGADSGTVESTITGLYPYGRYALNDRVTTWGVIGYGSGTLGLTPEDQPTIETDIDLAMAALGLRGVVVPAPAEGGAEITLTTDALGVQTTSAAVDGDLAATQATVTRLRLGAESAWQGLVLGGGALAPRVELGLRHDGGDAETGFGLDVGGALGWSDPTRGVSAEVHARGLLTHESDGFADRGFAGSIAYDPRPRSDRGWALTLRQSIGASATGGVDALLGQRTFAGLGAEDGDELSHRRLELRVGYGIPAFDERFTATPELGLGLSDDARSLSLGVRLGLARRGPVSLDAALEATRRESAGAEASEHGIALGLNARF